MPLEIARHCDGIVVARPIGETRRFVTQAFRERKPIMSMPAIPCRNSGDYLTVPLRLALALSFLLSVADRLGLLGPPGTPGVAWGNFTDFLAYNAQVNSFAPSAIRPVLGVTATILESLFGATLLLGVRTRLAARGAAGLLFVYGLAMAISFGIKSPFDYSVFSAMGGSLLLAAWGVYPLSADSLIDFIRTRRAIAALSVLSRGAIGEEETSCKPWTPFVYIIPEVPTRWSSNAHRARGLRLVKSWSESLPPP
jgi:putative oxidoreductase